MVLNNMKRRGASHEEPSHRLASYIVGPVVSAASRRGRDGRRAGCDAASVDSAAAGQGDKQSSQASTQKR
jgi:hypothetical protein